MEIENEKIRYSVSRKNFFVKLAVIFMILSALCRFLGYWGFWSNQTAGFVTFQIVLPILCNLLFIVLVLYAGRRFFSLTFIPVILGVMFFIIKASGLTAYCTRYCAYACILPSRLSTRRRCSALSGLSGCLRRCSVCRL